MEHSHWGNCIHVVHKFVGQAELDWSNNINDLSMAEVQFISWVL